MIVRITKETPVATSNAIKQPSQTAGQKLGTTELLYRTAQQMNLDPHWITPGGLFAVTFNGRERYVNFARSPLNSHTSSSLTKNKYLTRLILERHQMPNIPFIRPTSQDAAAVFLATHKKIIAKPLTGSGAHDIHIITEPSQLTTLNITKYILEKYIVGQEMRYLVLNGAVIGVHRSDYGTSVLEDRQLLRISYPHEEWDPQLTSTAIRAASALDLNFAAVDFLVTQAGRPYVLEVNSAPGLKWFHAPSSGPVVDVARQFLEAVFKPAGTAEHAGDDHRPRP